MNLYAGAEGACRGLREAERLADLFVTPLVGYRRAEIAAVDVAIDVEAPFGSLLRYQTDSLPGRAVANKVLHRGSPLPPHRTNWLLLGGKNRPAKLVAYDKLDHVLCSRMGLAKEGWPTAGAIRPAHTVEWEHATAWS